MSGFQGAGPNVYKLDEGEFRGHLQSIARAGASPVFTFDDGGSSAVAAAGMLEEFGWRGHFFITTDRIGTRGFLSEAQLVELRRRGHVIGSHSCSHPARMTSCTRAELGREWGESLRKLGRVLGGAANHRVDSRGLLFARDCGGGGTGGRAGAVHFGAGEVEERVVEGCTVGGTVLDSAQGFRQSGSASVVAGDVWPRLQQYLFWNAKKFLKMLVGPGGCRCGGVF